MSARDQKIADKNRGVLSTSFRPDRSQIVNITDMLSEGPIEGLVNGEGSIKLNKDPIKDILVEGTIATSSYTLIKDGSPRDGVITPAIYTDAIPGITKTAIQIQVNNAYDSNVGTSALIFPGGMAQAQSSFKPYIELDTTISFAFPSWINNVRIVKQYSMRLAREDSPKTYLKGKFERYSDTTGRFYFKDTNTSLIQVFLDEAEEAGSQLKLQLDYDNTVIASLNDTNVLFVADWDLGPGNFSNITITRILAGRGNASVSAGSKYKSVSTQFRPGTFEQEPMLNYGNSTGVSFAQGPSFQNQALEFWDVLSQEYKDLVEVGGDTSGLNLNNVNPVSFRATSPTGFGLTYEQAPEVDEIRFTFSYNSLYTYHAKDNDYKDAGVFYNTKLKLYRGADISEVNLRAGDTQLLHSAGKNGSRGPLLIEERVWLEPFKPFDDFELIIERTTRQEGRGVYPSGKNSGRSTTMHASSAITNISSIIKEPLNYPYTAYANVRFDSTEFTSAPQRTYELRGMRVKIPSNYSTREENNTDVATYEGLWDGSFRTELTYTDNPAWVFYDLVTNNRYGLGGWIKDTDIDKYALYRIAKYCDDLVPDGKGGLEPRYRANLYLTKAVDAYKLLKDIASIFVGLVYWLDGKVTPIADQASWPVYTFTASNVVDGKFNYTGTGAKTRPNQIVIGYNNPDKDYIIDPIIVEDRTRISQENRVQSKYVNAFGATSEGQAQRYGRYKLWTSNYQTELVSFKTSLNAAFIRPGDVIQVQDQARDRLISSGRVSAATSTTITLDRKVPLQDDITYSLYGLITTSAAFCAQTTAEIDGVVYNNAEVLPLELYVDETTASNILDDSGVPVTVRWAPYTFMEERSIDYATTTGGVAGSYDVVTITSPFTASLIPSSIWSIAQLNTEYQLDIIGSPRLYKILSMSQEDVNIYSITAVEHYNEKYEDVESGFDIYQADRFDPPIERAALRVPAPTAIYVAQDSDFRTRADEVIVKWLPPIVDGEEYQYLAGYKISHNIPGAPNPIFTEKGLDAYSFTGLSEGTYQIGVQTISTLGTSSTMTTVTYALNDPFSLLIQRLADGVGVGGTSLKSPFITAGATPTFKFNSPQELIVFPSAAPELPLLISNTDTLDLTSTGIEEDKTYYVLAKSGGALQPDDDSSVARNGSLKLIDFYTEGGFWYDVIDTAGVPADNFSNTSLTSPSAISIKRGEVYLQGTGTSFSSEIEARDYIRIIDTNSSEVVHDAKVLAVISDELLILNNPATSNYDTGYEIKKSSLNFLFEEDTVVASVRKSSATSEWTIVNYLTNDPDVDKARLVNIIKDGGDAIEYDVTGTALSDQVVLNIDTTGYTNPIVTVTGDAFNSLDESEDTVGTAGDNQTRTFTLSDTSYDASTLEFNVSIVEGGDPDNVTTAIDTNYYIKKQYDASSFIRFEDLEVTVATASGTGNLTYDDAGLFTYTPPAISTPAILSNGTNPSLNTNITDLEIRTLIGAGTSNLALGTTAGTALEGDTALLQLGTTAGTALAGDTALLQLGTTAGTALEGDTALLELGTTAGTALAGDTALLQLGTTSTTALAGDTVLTTTLLSLTDVGADGTSGQVLTTDGNGSFTFEDAEGGVTTETDPIFNAHTTSNISDGTGFLKNTAGTWSYDNSTYLTTETSHADVVVDGDFTSQGFMVRGASAGTYSIDNTTYLGNIVEDVTPQLGANLDGQTFNITTTGDLSATDITATKGLYVGNSTATFSQDDIRAEGNIYAYWSSDINMKTDIHPMENALSKVMNISGVNFNWKDKTIQDRGGEDGYFVKKRDVGIIAQEVEKVLPEVVSTRKDGTLAVRYEGLVPLLIEAIKDLEKKVRRLEGKDAEYTED